MGEAKSYFFVGIGGSGILLLAMIVRGRGDEVKGSDRSLDQGRLSAKFDDLRRQGIELFSQDGSGITSADQIVVASAAVEEHVGDLVKARAVGASRIGRPELLAELFNAAQSRIAVGGTSGKSTVTGMIGWILHAVGRDPTVMNGAVMKNFASPDRPFASALVGYGPDFVSEVDESDGSIALYEPGIAVLNNITLDHKSLDELRHLFRDFAAKAGTVVLNLDDDETRLLAAALAPEKLRTCSLKDTDADLFGSEIVEAPFAISFQANGIPVRLQVPGRHNVENALVALGAAEAAGVPLAQAAEAIAGFKGLRRRFELIGEAGGISVIDDFAHNPDKIAATLRTLHAFPGRLLVFFQPHGYGPLRMMGGELTDTFVNGLGPEDLLIMPDPVYYGGTTDRNIASDTVTTAVAARGRSAEHVADRAAAGERLAALSMPGDRIIVMGARDDTLTLFAEDVLARLGQQA